jgi:hypothetical protein
MTGLSAGIVGQLLLPATDPAGFRPFCIVAIILAFALVPIALTQAVAPTQEAEGVRISPKRLYQQSPFGLVAASLCGVITSAFFALAPILAQRLGLDTRGVAVFDGQRHPWRVSPGLTYRLAFGPLRPTRCHHRHGAHGHRSLFTMIALVRDEPSRWILYLCAAILVGRSFRLTVSSWRI